GAVKGLKDQPPFAAPELALTCHQTASQDRPQHIRLVELGVASDQDFGHQLRIADETGWLTPVLEKDHVAVAPGHIPEEERPVVRSRKHANEAMPLRPRR